MPFTRSKIESKEESGTEIVYDRVKEDELPKFSDLNNEVMAFVNRCSWWEKYGVDWCITGMGFIMSYVALICMQSSSPLTFCLGVFIYGYCYQMFAVRCAHASVHNSLCEFRAVNRILGFFFGDFLSSFSSDVGYDIHIRVHHPHTNIIGLGDSSSWKMSFLPALFYMYFAPLLLPLMSVPVSLKELWGQWKKMARYVILMLMGYFVNVALLMKISGFSFTGALLCILVSRGLLSIPYIHVNVFQHIGLPMYSRDHRPKKIYLMSTGVLNLPRNPILDFTFGHAIISAHVEHHLFPHMSDNMCLMIKPIVSRFLKKNGLPYNEDSYLSRMWHFTVKYKELMVNAPPITHFVGIQ
ncbi:fatty acid desaturase 6-like [Ostrea edulis]|uniref:fatty acid desaturase 6-like n=1 Tax=Ostrea edulis TaxID=37623 RepID=UPI0024AEFF6E|nr:fatty acid desaturase 6-like [Ostrea edulis]